MRITHNKVGQNLNTSDTSRADQSKKTDKLNSKSSVSSPEKATVEKSNSTPTSQVNLSDRAQEMKKIKDLAMAAPDVDEAKVAHFQKLIDSGKYQVDAKEIADKMVDEHLNWT